MAAGPTRRPPASAAAAPAPLPPPPGADALPPCLRAHGAGCVLDLSVAPNARRTQADGLHDGALRVRLAAPPVDGKANDALLAWLADALGCAKRDLTLLRGHSGRRKQVAVARAPALVATIVARWLNENAAQERGV